MSDNKTDGRDYHQELCDQAYIRWNNGDLKGVSYETFVSSLDELQKHAVVLGKLNQQVCNGGWTQWAANGYSDAGEETTDALQNMIQKGFPLAKTVLPMVVEVLDVVEQVEEICVSDFDVGGSHYEGCGCEIEDEEDGYDPYDAHEEYLNEANDFDGFDDEYYRINEDFMVQCEVYLRQRGEIPISQEMLDHYAEALTRDLKPDKPAAEATPDKPSKPRVRLTGRDGNAFSTIAAVAKALREAGYPRGDIDRFKTEALAGDYNNVLATAMQWADVR